MMSFPHLLKEYTSPSVIILCIIFNSSSVLMPTGRRARKKRGLGDAWNSFLREFHESYTVVLSWWNSWQSFFSMFPKPPPPPCSQLISYSNFPRGLPLLKWTEFKYSPFQITICESLSLLFFKQNIRLKKWKTHLECPIFCRLLYSESL